MINIPDKQKFKPHRTLDNVVIRFAGDSGDGMQVVGSQFTSASALSGNDVHTFPDYPAEIRAPAGTLAGISGFQVSVSKHVEHTPGDEVDVLVAMNPAALKVNLKDIRSGGTIIVNSDAFSDRDLKKSKYTANPLEDGSLDAYRVFAISLTKLTINAVSKEGLVHSQVVKCKNLFALGLVCWLFDRHLDSVKNWLEKKFAKDTAVKNANLKALQAGYHFAETTELFTEYYQIEKANLPKGHYRQINGNEAFALACATAAKLSGQTVLLSGYPITPASLILHQVAKYASYGVKTFQAEDEIAAISAAIGAAYGGSLALCSTSGPGLDLKSEAMGLAVITEMPLVLIDVQRGGPSTGLPTKTEQADLLAAMYGRHGECPVPILAPATPGECFSMLIQAFNIAITYMTPVIVLSDGYLANGTEPWIIPDIKNLPNLKPTFHSEVKNFSPMLRDEKTLARVWAVPGTKGLEHRIGGLERDFVTGEISYDAENHQLMTNLRQEKIARIAKTLPPLSLIGKSSGAVLIISWGSTYGSILSAVEQLQGEDKAVSLLHLRYLNPLRKEIADIASHFKTILIPELNMGQLSKLLRIEFLLDAVSFSKVTGKPFLIHEIIDKVQEYLV